MYSKDLTLGETVAAHSLVSGQFYLYEATSVPQVFLGCRAREVWSPSTGLLDLPVSEVLTHLPNGYKWADSPSYTDLHRECGLRVGDSVRVAMKTEPLGWGDAWVDDMDELIGLVLKVTHDLGDSGFKLSDARNYPCTSLARVTTEVSDVTEDAGDAVESADGIHLVRLSNGQILQIQEGKNSLHIAAMHGGEVDAYICEINASGVLVMPNSGSAGEYLTAGLKGYSG